VAAGFVLLAGTVLVVIVAVRRSGAG
jgi:hypothetical protein